MVRVLSVDAARRRLSLSLRQAHQLDEISGEASAGADTRPADASADSAPELAQDAQEATEEQHDWGEPIPGQ